MQRGVDQYTQAYQYYQTERWNYLNVTNSVPAFIQILQAAIKNLTLALNSKSGATVQLNANNGQNKPGSP